MSSDPEKMRRVIRSHSQRIIENRKELAALKAQVRHVRELVQRCESRGVLMVPVSIVKDALESPGRCDDRP